MQCRGYFSRVEIESGTATAGRRSQFRGGVGGNTVFGGFLPLFCVLSPPLLSPGFRSSIEPASIIAPAARMEARVHFVVTNARNLSSISMRPLFLSSPFLFEVCLTIIPWITSRISHFVIDRNRSSSAVPPKESLSSDRPGWMHVDSGVGGPPSETRVRSVCVRIYLPSPILEIDHRRDRLDATARTSENSSAYIFDVREMRIE